jgi:hypothetical protein
VKTNESHPDEGIEHPRKPKKGLTGDTLHYPSAREIAELDKPQPSSRSRGAKLLLLGFALFVALVWALAFIANEPPTQLDPLRRHLRERLMHLW